MEHRKIIHVDMDAFFASIEQRDHPELKGKPVAVGGTSERGVVAAASYEARKYGVRSAMPSRVAARKCPQLIFVKHRFDVYKEVSRQIREIFHQYTDLVEPLSLDEAYLDVTENKFDYHSAMFMASEIKKKVKEKTSLTASAGISINKFLAKVASDMDKPDGFTVILPEEVEAFVEQLPIEKFYGVGKATQDKMHRLGISTGKDLKTRDRIELINLFGKFGNYLYDVSRGIDNRPVRPDRIRKSFSLERTFNEDIEGKDHTLETLSVLCKKLADSLQKKGIKGKTLNLKLRYSDFTTLTRSKTVGGYFNEENTIYDMAAEMTLPLIKEEMGIRLLGVGLSNLNNQGDEVQLELDF